MADWKTPTVEEIQQYQAWLATRPPAVAQAFRELVECNLPGPDEVLGAMLTQDAAMTIMLKGALKEERFALMQQAVLEPWLHEADFVAFEHAGLRCAILRHEKYKHWRGYVEIPADHPWALEKDAEGGHYYADAEVHGGVTWNRPWGEVPLEDPMHGWGFVVGFDCGHYMDLMPGFVVETSRILDLTPEEVTQRFSALYSDAIYRTQSYVENETRQLAEQARKAAEAT